MRLEWQKCLPVYLIALISQVKNGPNLFNVDAEIEEVLVFAGHRLAVEASSFARQNTLDKFLL